MTTPLGASLCEMLANTLLWLLHGYSNHNLHPIPKSHINTAATFEALLRLSNTFAVLQESTNLKTTNIFLS